MSQSAEYSRNDWWGEDVDGSTDQAGAEEYRENGQGEEWGSNHHFVDGEDPASQITREILSQDATKLCGRTLEDDPWNGGRTRELFSWLTAGLPPRWADPDGWPVDGRADELHHEQRPVELSRPTWTRPKVAPDAHGGFEYGQFRHRARVNPETGYLNFNDTTTTRLEELSTEQFMAAVEDWLARNHADLRQYYLEQAMNLAKSRKCNPELGDQEALQLVVEKVREQKDPNEPNPFSKPEP